MVPAPFCIPQLFMVSRISKEGRTTYPYIAGLPYASRGIAKIRAIPERIAAMVQYGKKWRLKALKGWDAMRTHKETRWRSKVLSKVCLQDKAEMRAGWVSRRRSLLGMLQGCAAQSCPYLADG